MRESYVLSAEYKALLDRLMREWKAGRLRLGGAPGRPTRRPAADRHADLYEVTGLDEPAGACAVRMPDPEGGLSEATELTGVLYETGKMPAVGDRGQVLRLAGGRLVFHPGGGGTAVMVVAKEASIPGTANPVECAYCGVGGQEGDTVELRPPYGISVKEGDVGFIGEAILPLDISWPVFIPCHARRDPGLPLVVEVRDGSDPPSPVDGQIWMREDTS